ncbi:MAG: type IV secretory system conjugative DNA transfer family protein [Solirubrobacteraceae bacterium]
MSQQRDAEHGLEAIAAILLAVVLALCAMIWVTAGVAGVLFGAGWPRMGASSVADALIGLPAHFSDPRLAWPQADRSAIPSAAAFYTALSLVLLTIVLLLTALKRLHDSGAFSWGDGRSDERSGARWGSTRDLAALHARRRTLAGPRGAREGGRLALGFRGGRLMRAEARHALVVFGPPQSGKSAGVAIPALLEWDGPAVASSIKTDLYQATVCRREALGEVMVFDPYGLAPARGSTWSPLRGARTWDGALSTALRMTAAGELDTSEVKGGGYWSAAAEQRLAPLLWTAARTGGGVQALVRWAYGQGDAELPAILHGLLEKASDGPGLADVQAAYDAHVAFEAMAGETRSSVESTVQMLLRAYRSPRVQASAASCEITPERLLQGAGTLYLIGDSHRSKLLRPIFLCLLQELIDHAYHQATIRGGRLSLPLLLCLDELGNIAPLPNLAEVASTAPSHNIQLVSIFHDLAQAKSRYGSQAHTVINSHRARMLLPGVADLETLRYFSDLLGEHRTRDRDQDRQVPERRPLAAPERLRQLPENHALLVYGRLAPTQLRLRAYYTDRKLRGLSEQARSDVGE